MRLFDEHGFTATTIDQIADGVRRSPRATVLNYFATKEDIVFGDAPRRWTRSASRARAPGEADDRRVPRVAPRARELGGWIEPELVLQLRARGGGADGRCAPARAAPGVARSSPTRSSQEFGPDRRVAATLAAASLTAAMEVVEHTAAATAARCRTAEIDRLLGDAVRFAEAGMAAMQQH